MKYPVAISFFAIQFLSFAGSASALSSRQGRARLPVCEFYDKLGNPAKLSMKLDRRASHSFYSLRIESKNETIFEEPIMTLQGNQHGQVFKTQSLMLTIKYMRNSNGHLGPTTEGVLDIRRASHPRVRIGLHFIDCEYPQSEQ